MRAASVRAAVALAALLVLSPREPGHAAGMAPPGALDFPYPAKPSNRALVAPAPDSEEATVTADARARVAPASGDFRWRRVQVAAGGGLGLTAVAVDRGSGRIAVGHAEGVRIAGPGEPFRFAARVPVVRDLHFGRDGSLWIASLRGLWQLSPDGRLAERSPATGEAARSTRRIATADGILVVATGAGAFAARDDGAAPSWRRLGDGLPMGPVTALALAPSDEAGTIVAWLSIDTGVWRVRLRRDGDRVLATGAVREGMAGGPAGVPPVDVSTRLPGARAVVLYPRAIAVLAAGPGPRFERTAWAFRRPVLPPGSTANRILSAAGRLWLATDRGLLEAASFDGPWRRAGVPAGSTPARAIASSTTDDTVLVASGSGLLRGSPVLAASSSPAEAAGAIGPPVPVDPPIVAVQRASLGYLGIGPERMRELRRGVDRRGWLPDLSLRFAAASDWDRARDLDESFVSGEMRKLHDRANDDSIGLDGSITMSWDLGDVAFAPDAIDVSRESRQVISLRDDVLDEVNQLYFERQGALARLGGPGLEAADRRGLWLRVGELGAGLDAWTGGWFSQQVRVTDRLSFPDAKFREGKHPDHGAQARPSAPRSTE